MDNGNLGAELTKLLNDEDFAGKLENAESPEDAVKLFAEHGVNVSAEQLKTFAAGNPEDGALDEEALEAVAGGILAPRAQDIYRMTEWLRRIFFGGSSGGGGHSSGGGRRG